MLDEGHPATGRFSAEDIARVGVEFALEYYEYYESKDHARTMELYAILRQQSDSVATERDRNA